MTLFFPASTSDVKINASNSQVNVTVGESMTISAGDSFSITAGSNSTIKIGPSTSFSLASSVNINLNSTLSYSYGFTAAYGMSNTATNVTSSQMATDSYSIQAGTYTPVQQALALGQDKQIYYVLLATVVSMGAIALAVVGGLSSPMFIKDPNNSNNTNAVSNNSADMVRAACAMSITTVAVFMAQWGLTYLLAKSSKFSPVTSLVLNSTGITANVQTLAANKANLMYDDATIIPSVETIMYASPDADLPTLTHRVNQAPVMGTSPQLSEIILTTKQINLNSTTSSGGVNTHNTQIILNSENQTISLQSDSAALAPGGAINIGKNTSIYNPNGLITLFSEAGTTLGDALLEIESGTKASLSCSDGTLIGTGAIVATPSMVSIGVTAPTGGNAMFNSTGVTINGANISIGGAITILGAPAPNTNLNTVISDVAANTVAQQELAMELKLAQAELLALKKAMLVAQSFAEAQSALLKNTSL